MKKIIVIIAGILFLAVGVFLFISGKNQEKRCTVEAVGTVVEIIEDISTEMEDNIERTTYTYYPVIEYKVGERTVSKKSSTGSGSSKYHINDKVDIVYNPDNIEEYIIKGDKTSNILGIVFAIAGIIVVIIGIVKQF